MMRMLQNSGFSVGMSNNEGARISNHQLNQLLFTKQLMHLTGTIVQDHVSICLAVDICSKVFIRAKMMGWSAEIFHNIHGITGRTNDIAHGLISAEQLI